ncbi:MAG: hypothetical protein AAF633_27880, partial [Chloroflexota bacterium]
LGIKVEQYDYFSTLTGEVTPNFIRPLEETFNSVELVGEPVSFNHLVTTDLQGGGVVANIIHTYVPVFTIGVDGREIIGETYQDVLSNFGGGLGNRFAMALYIEMTNSSPSGSSETIEREVVDLIGVEVRQGGGVADIAASRGDTTQPYINPSDIFQIHAFSQKKNPELLAAASVQGIMKNSNLLAEVYTEIQELNDENALSFFEAYGLYLLETQRSQLKMIAEDFFFHESRFSTLFSNSTLVKNYPNKPKLILLTQSGNETESNLTFELINNRDRVVASPEQAKVAEFEANYLLSLSSKATELEQLRALSNDTTLISALKVIEVANQAGIDSVLISAATLDTLEHIDISLEAKARISDAVQDGHLVIVPPQMILIEGEEQIGWLQIDQTGYVSAVMEGGEQAGFLSYLLSWQFAITLAAPWIGMFSFLSSWLITMISTFVMTFLACVVDWFFGGNPACLPSKGAVAVAIIAADLAAMSAGVATCAAWTVGVPEATLLCGFGVGAGTVLATFISGFILGYHLAADPPLPAILVSQYGADPGISLGSPTYSGVVHQTATYASTNVVSAVENNWVQFFPQTTQTISLESGGQTENLTWNQDSSPSFYAAATGAFGSGISPTGIDLARFVSGLSATLTDTNLAIGGGTGAFTLGGQALDSSSGFALANYGGTLALQPQT